GEQEERQDEQQRAEIDQYIGVGAGADAKQDRQHQSLLEHVVIERAEKLGNEIGQEAPAAQQLELRPFCHCCHPSLILKDDSIAEAQVRFAPGSSRALRPPAGADPAFRSRTGCAPGARRSAGSAAPARRRPCTSVRGRRYRAPAGTSATGPNAPPGWHRSEEHTSELQSRENLVCRLLLEKKK